MSGSSDRMQMDAGERLDKVLKDMAALIVALPRSSEVETLKDKLLNAIVEADCVALDNYTLGLVMEDMNEEIVARVREVGKLKRELEHAEHINGYLRAETAAKADAEAEAPYALLWMINKTAEKALQSYYTRLGQGPAYENYNNAVSVRELAYALRNIGTQADTVVKEYQKATGSSHESNIPPQSEKVKP